MVQVDPEILAGFVDEVRGYLPQMQEPLGALGVLPLPREKVIDAHRYIHRLRGSASMLGLHALSEAAATLEELLESVAQGRLNFEPEWAPILADTIPPIETYLRELPGSAGVEPAFPKELLETYRALLEKAAETASTDLSVPFDFDDDGFALNAPPSSNLESAEGSEPTGSSEVAPELLEVFQVEAEEYVREIGGLLHRLSEDMSNREVVQQIRRAAHTLKGAAAMVGFESVNRLTHRMEDLLDRIYEGTQSVDEIVIGLLFTATDALEDLIAGKPDPDVLRKLYQRYDERLGQAESAAETTAERDLESAEPPEEDADSATTAPAPVRARKGGRLGRQVVRASVEELEKVSRVVGELVITRTALEQRLARIFANLEELRASNQRLQRVVNTLESEFETAESTGNPLAGVGETANGTNFHTPLTEQAYGFDDLEFDRYTEFNLLSHALAETSGDIRTVAEELQELAGDFETLLARQGRQSSEVEDRLKRLRMVPLSTLATRLERTVRNVADGRGKEVSLVLEGGEVTLDKTALEGMADPLLHLLRNAVDHGIETPDFREAVGKPRTGKICVRASSEGNQVLIRVEDDGAGLHPHALRSAAVQRGFLTAEAAEALSDERARELIFLPGFSTARNVSDISGRGVGLDVVRHTVHKLEGTLRVESAPGRGTAFLIALPVTVGLTRALVVRANQETFAIPLPAVNQVLRVDRAEIEQTTTGATIRLGEKSYPLVYLRDVLNLKQAAATPDIVPIILLSIGGRLTGLAVDQLLGGREIIIKRLGTHLRRVRGVTGATLLGDGSVVLILNPAELLADAAPAPTRERTVSPAGSATLLTVMIVDDSPSVRRVASNLVRRGGWIPVVAKDGMECLDTLYRSGAQPDIILLDIEMPRMDGYEVLSALRSQDAYRELPVVVVTSRSGEKHRRKAAELGASGYLVKPYPDEALFTVVRNLLAHTGKPLGL